MAIVNNKESAARRVAVFVALVAFFLLGIVGCVMTTGSSIDCSGNPAPETMEGVAANQAPDAADYASVSGAYKAEEAYYCSEEYPTGPIETPDPFNTEEYASVREGGFVSASTRPLSTLSADVDTASYSNLRRMINEGYTKAEIPDGAVRIEEMLNYFTYDYAQPTGDDLFATSVQVGDCPWNPDTKLLVMGFSTAPETRENSAGSNLVFLVDVSGSMDAPDKLDLLKDSFGQLVDELEENDRVSIVTYASGEDVVLEGARGSDKRVIMRAINRLRAEGSTNGEAGLEKAYQIAEDNFIEGGVNRIILASDGDLNVGMTDESSLDAYVSKKRDTGVYLSVLGFGTGNYKDNKMEVLADNGNGQYHYIDCAEEAKRVFGQNLTANLVPLADDVKLQVEFNPAQVKGYRLIGYENRALADEDFRDDAKDAGEVGAGHQFTVAYEVALADSAMDIVRTDLKYADQAPATQDKSDEWLTCTMRYRPASGGDAKEQSVVVDGSAWSDSPNDDWRFAAAVIEAGMVLRNSEYVGSSTLDDALNLLPAENADPMRAEFADLVDRVA